MALWHSRDYPSAASYLSLIVSADQVNELVERLKAAPLSHCKAKDMLRASGLPLLAKDNPHVAADLAKVKNNKALSPGAGRSGRPLSRNQSADR